MSFLDFFQIEQPLDFLTGLFVAQKAAKTAQNLMTNLGHQTVSNVAHALAKKHYGETLPENLDGLGSFGNLLYFKVNSDEMTTFKEFSKNAAGKWEQFNRLNNKPTSRFVAPELNTISFAMDFRPEFGQVPKKALENLETAVESGFHGLLAIGGSILGEFYISDISESWDRIDNHGRLLEAGVTVNLTEYCE